MSSAGIAMRSAWAGVMALLLAVAAQALAQAPAHVLALSPATHLQVPDMFDGKPRADGAKPPERAGQWMLYGRFKVVNFEKSLDSDTSDTRFSLRRTGPSLGGSVSVGIRRRF